MVLESPTERGLVVMVVAWSLWEHRPGNRAVGGDAWSWNMDSVVLSDPGRLHVKWPVGSTQRVSGKPGRRDDWIVVEG